MSSSLEHLVAGSQGVITKRIDLALLEAHEQRASRCAWTRAALDFVARNSWQERGIEYQRLVDSLVAGSGGAHAVAI